MPLGKVPEAPLGGTPGFTTAGGTVPEVGGVKLPPAGGVPVLGGVRLPPAGGVPEFGAKLPFAGGVAAFGFAGVNTPPAGGWAAGAWVFGVTGAPLIGACAQKPIMTLIITNDNLVKYGFICFSFNLPRSLPFLSPKDSWYWWID